MQTLISRRSVLQSACASVVFSASSELLAQEAVRRFEPKPQGWRTFDVTTTVQIKAASGATRVWLPVTSLDTPWQRTVDVSYSSEAANLELLRDKATLGLAR